MYPEMREFQCGYYCRYCGKFNISNGSIKREYHSDDEGKRKALIAKSYNFLRDKANKKQRVSYYNGKTDNDVNGECSACGKTQPWARPWTLRGRSLGCLRGCLLYVIEFTGVSLTYRFIFVKPMFSILCLGGMWLVYLLSTVTGMKISQGVYDLQYLARDRAIHKEMKDSPYYKQSYPYIACEDDTLDLNDARARRMAAELWPDKLQNNDLPGGVS